MTGSPNSSFDVSSQRLAKVPHVPPLGHGRKPRMFLRRAIKWTSKACIDCAKKVMRKSAKGSDLGLKQQLYLSCRRAT